MGAARVTTPDGAGGSSASRTMDDLRRRLEATLREMAPATVQWGLCNVDGRDGHSARIAALSRDIYANEFFWMRRKMWK